MEPILSKAKISFFLCAFIALLFTETAYSQKKGIVQYPTRPITNITPITPGGPTDLAVRLMLKEAEKFLGQPIIALNKPGGAGSIGLTAIANSKPDGYTIGQSHNSGLLMVPHMEKVSYHSIKDFKQIIQFGVLILE